MSAPGLTSGAIQAPTSSGPTLGMPMDGPMSSGAMPNQLAAPTVTGPSNIIFPGAPTQPGPGFSITPQIVPQAPDNPTAYTKYQFDNVPNQQPFPTAPVPPGATQIPNMGKTQQQLIAMGLLKPGGTQPTGLAPQQAQAQMAAITHPVTGALVSSKGTPIHAPAGAMQGRLVPAQTMPPASQPKPKQFTTPSSGRNAASAQYTLQGQTPFQNRANYGFVSGPNMAYRPGYR